MKNVGGVGYLSAFLAVTEGVREGKSRKVKTMGKRTLIGVLVVFFAVCSSVFGAVLHVPMSYPTIQAAINSAVPGDRVIVSPGTYNENINFNGKSITVTSTDPNNPAIVAGTIIDAGGSGSAVTFANGEGPDAVITGFTITGGFGTYNEVTDYIYYVTGFGLSIGHEVRSTNAENC